MYKFLIFTFIIIFLISCGENTDDKFIDQHELILNCDPSEYEIEKFTYCDSTIDNDPSICDYINLGEIFLLPDTKQHSKYICSPMQSVTFENENGEELVLKKHLMQLNMPHNGVNLATVILKKAYSYVHQMKKLLRL